MQSANSALVLLLDELDIQILRALMQGRTMLPSRPGLGLSFRAIAKSLAVSEGTIRNRIETMSSSGLIRGSTVFVNPKLLGLTCGTYGFQVSEKFEKKKVIEQLKLVEGMVIIQNHHGSYLGLAFMYENDDALQKKIALIKSIGGSEGGLLDEMLFPTCNISLTKTEWRVISYLVKMKFQSYKKLGEDIGLSERTMNRIISRLIDVNAIFSVPTLNLKAIKGGVAADLVAFFASPEARCEAEAEILELIDNYMFYAGIWKEEGVYNLILPNAAVATELHERVQHIEGVGLSLMELVDERIDQTEILGNYVRKRAELSYD